MFNVEYFENLLSDDYFEIDVSNDGYILVNKFRIDTNQPMPAVNAPNLKFRAFFQKIGILPQEAQATIFRADYDALKTAMNAFYSDPKQLRSAKMVFISRDTQGTGGYFITKQIINRIPINLFVPESYSASDISAAIEKSLNDAANANVIMSRLKPQALQTAKKTGVLLYLMAFNHTDILDTLFAQLNRRLLTEVPPAISAQMATFLHNIEHNLSNLCTENLLADAFERWYDIDPMHANYYLNEQALPAHSDVASLKALISLRIETNRAVSDAKTAFLTLPVCASSEEKRNTLIHTQQTFYNTFEQFEYEEHRITEMFYQTAMSSVDYQTSDYRELVALLYEQGSESLRARLLDQGDIVFVDNAPVPQQPAEIDASTEPVPANYSWLLNVLTSIAKEIYLLAVIAVRQMIRFTTSVASVGARFFQTQNTEVDKDEPLDPECRRVNASYASNLI